MLPLIYALYLLAGNVFLNSPLARSELNRKPETVQVRWSWAWTIWPGQIGVHDIQLHGHARKLLWALNGTSARGRILLVPLFHRELRFGRIQAVDVEARLQLTHVDHRPPPWRADAWHIAFNGVHTTSLQRAQLGDVVIEGNGEGTVGFIHQLRGGPTRIFPSHVRFTEARVRYQQHLLLRDTRLQATFAVDTFTHDQPVGWSKAERAVGRLRLNGITSSLAGPVDATNFHLAEGRLNADLSFDHGALLPGGTAQWSGPLATQSADGVAQLHSAHVAIAVGADALALQANVLPEKGTSSVDAASQTSAAHSAEAQLMFASRQLLPLRSYADTIKLVSGSSRFHWHFASLKWLTPLLISKPWLSLQGSGEAVGELRVDAGALLPGSRVDIPNVAVTADILESKFAGEAHALINVENGPPEQGLSMSLTTDHFTVVADGSNTPYLRGNALQLTMRSSRQLAKFRQALASRLRFANANIPDLRAYNHYLPGKSLQFLGGTGTMSADVHMDGVGNISNATVQMSSRSARAALGPSRLSGDLNLDTQLSASKRGPRAYDLNRWTLGLDGVRVDGSRDPPWWTKLSVEHGRLDWARPMRLRGHVTMVMKDVSLLLSVFADRGAFPKWIGSVIDDGEATADAQLDARHGDVILDQLVASNKRAHLLARLRVRDGKTDGDLYVRWGLLGLGVGLDDGKHEFHLLHAARWYESQPALLSSPPAQ